MSNSAGNTTAGTGQHHGFCSYPKLKPSGVEWLGDVPEHWEVRRLKYLVSINDEVLSETTAPDYRMRYIDIGGVDHVQGIHSFEHTTFRHAPSRARRIVRHGDIIVSTVRTYLRAIAPIRQPAPNTIVSTGFAVLRPRSSLSSTFAYFALSAPGFIDDVVARSVGANYPAINADEIGNIPIAVPLSLDEQRTAARYLNHEIAKIDALIARNKALIKHLEEHRTALISRTVTRGLPPAECRKAGIDPHPKLKPSGVQWLGDVPEHWEVAQLGRIGHLFKGSGGTMSDDVTKGVPCVRYGDLYTTYHYHIKYSHRFVSEQASEMYTSIRFGDVLFAGSGETIEEIGKSAVNLLQGDACCGGDVIVMRPNRAFDPVYLGYVAESPHASWQKACTGRGVTVMHTYATDLRKVAVPFPPVAEQQVIARYLDRQTTRLDKAGEVARYENDLLREYRTRLIADVVTGKVHVRNIADTDVEAEA